MLFRERMAEVKLGVGVERGIFERALERGNFGGRQRGARDLRQRRPGAMATGVEA